MSYENFKKGAQYFARFLDTVGDGTGDFNANVLGTLENPVDFKIVVPEGKILFIQELVVTVRDSGQFVAGG